MDTTVQRREEDRLRTTWNEIQQAHDEVTQLNIRLERAIQQANELAVQASIETYEKSQILAAIPSILVSVDVYGKITLWNPAAEHALGIKAEQSVGQPFADLPMSWNWESLQNCIQALLQQKQKMLLNDFPFTRPDGREGYLGLTLIPIMDIVNEVQGFLLLGADITDRKRLENQLIQAQKLESIGQLAAGMAHEINTPIQYVGDNSRFLQDAFADLLKMLGAYSDLAAITRNGGVSTSTLDAIEALARDIDLDYLLEEIPRAIQQSLEGAGRVAGIVQAMKEFSHPGTPQKVALNVNHGIENTVTLARNEWKYVAEMTLDLDPALPEVLGLPGEFNQAILNLVINAAHAIQTALGDRTDERGRITITTRREEAGIVISVQDTGVGIPEANRKKVFDLFFTTKPVGQGTGQGLAMVHSVIVEKHGGQIRFESEVGKGTTFLLYLPLSTRPDTVEEAANGPASAA